MRKRFPDGGWRPTKSQRLLLRAALMKGEPALAAWREWSEREPRIEDLDGASDRLVGLLWRNLDAHGVDHPTMAKMKGVYRHAWFKNQSVLREADQPLRILREAGIPTLVLKGAALNTLYYRDFGVRRMDDLDMLVPVERAADATAAMRGAGCAGPPDRSIRAWYAGNFGPPGGWEVDLHWYSLWRSASDDGFWARAQPLELAGEQTLALGPTDQLLHVCAHGSEWGEIAPIRWVADADAILSNEEIDWDLFVEEAGRRLLTVSLASTLDYLRELIEAPVPEEVSSRLRAAPAPRFERVGWRSSCRPYSLGRTLRIVWERYRRLRALRPPGPEPLGPVSSYVRFAEFRWELKSPVQLPGYAVRWLASR